ncbi:hypothetical protein [Pseudomonas syringae]|uniref:hypothetical protein n=1 Tax=Pseudomonas syringae TaxID=317 RepID=UPI0018A13A99|nr:hypothetical protein [Pseudomonas syringae]
MDAVLTLCVTYWLHRHYTHINRGVHRAGGSDIQGFADSLNGLLPASEQRSQPEYLAAVQSRIPVSSGELKLIVSVFSGTTLLKSAQIKDSTIGGPRWICRLLPGGFTIPA